MNRDLLPSLPPGDWGSAESPWADDSESQSCTHDEHEAVVPSLLQPIPPTAHPTARNATPATASTAKVAATPAAAAKSTRPKAEQESSVPPAAAAPPSVAKAAEPQSLYDELLQYQQDEMDDAVETASTGRRSISASTVSSDRKPAALPRERARSSSPVTLSFSSGPDGNPSSYEGYESARYPSGDAAAASQPKSQSPSATYRQPLSRDYFSPDKRARPKPPPLNGVHSAGQDVDPLGAYALGTGTGGTDQSVVSTQSLRQEEEIDRREQVRARARSLSGEHLPRASAEGLSLRGPASELNEPPPREHHQGDSSNEEVVDDEELARRLQEEEEKAQRRDEELARRLQESEGKQHNPPPPVDEDEELARRLQQEEEQAQQSLQRQRSKEVSAMDNEWIQREMERSMPPGGGGGADGMEEQRRILERIHLEQERKQLEWAMRASSSGEIEDPGGPNGGQEDHYDRVPQGPDMQGPPHQKPMHAPLHDMHDRHAHGPGMHGALLPEDGNHGGPPGAMVDRDDPYRNGGRRGGGFARGEGMQPWQQSQEHALAELRHPQTREVGPWQQSQEHALSEFRRPGDERHAPSGLPPLSAVHPQQPPHDPYGGHQEQRGQMQAGLTQQEVRRREIVSRGQEETQVAIRSGQSHVVQCRGCGGRLQAPVQYSLVYCPTCGAVSPGQTTMAG